MKIFDLFQLHNMYKIQNKFPKTIMEIILDYERDYAVVIDFEDLDKNIRWMCLWGVIWFEEYNMWCTSASELSRLNSLLRFEPTDNPAYNNCPSLRGMKRIIPMLKESCSEKVSGIYYGPIDRKKYQDYHNDPPLKIMSNIDIDKFDLYLKTLPPPKEGDNERLSISEYRKTEFFKLYNI